MVRTPNLYQCLGHLQAEPGAIFDTTAPFIGPLVRSAIKELTSVNADTEHKKRPKNLVD